MSSTIGYEVLGTGVRLDVDLGVPLGEEHLVELRQLYAEHHLLVVEGQRLSLPDQVRVMGYLGPVKRADGPAGPLDYVSKDVALGGNFGDYGLGFHSDLAHSPVPHLGISLHALDVVDGATSTMFVDGARTLSRLPASTRARLDGLHALHCWPIVKDGQYRTFGAPPSYINEALPHCAHPLVMEHPTTGEPVLYAVAMMTDHIEELSLAESDDLLAELYSYLYEPDNIYEHFWKNGDLVVWDNIAVQHSRRDQRDVGPRTLQRVVTAEKDFYEQNPSMVWRDGNAFLAQDPT
jgi:taurine dioxygenase